MNKNFLLLLFLLITFGCKQRILPESPDKLYEKYRKSVILIKNQYYYQVELSNGLIGYFTEFNNGEISDLTFDEEDVKKKANIIYGTGFFISQDGKIATNRHVVSPYIDDTRILSALKIKFDNAKFKLSEYQNELTEKIDAIDNYINSYYDQIDYTSLQDLNDKKQEFENERTKLSALGLAFDFEPSKSNIKSKSVALGIAFDNTYVTNDEDYKQCVIYRKSNDVDVDLAIIQLKDKTTPSNIQNIFDFTDHNPNIKNGTAEKGEEYNLNSPLKIDTKVYMIGYNYGFAVGNTSEGLKAQLTQGTVSQEADNIRVLYSIPSLEGSSGSPIIDQWGNLVAINFAKVSNTQSFNYGIVAKNLRKLLDE